MDKKGITARQKNFKTFKIDFKSEVDDMRYIGTFTTKKLSISDMAALGVRKSQLNGGMHYDSSNPGRGVDQQTDNFNAMIAHLEIAIVEAPKWWDLEQISDTEVLGKVYEEVVKHENNFPGSSRELGERSERADGTGEGMGESDSSDSGAGRVARALVDEEVQTALEP